MKYFNDYNYITPYFIMPRTYVPAFWESILKVTEERYNACLRLFAAVEEKNAVLEEKNAVLEEQKAAVEEQNAALVKQNGLLRSRIADLEGKALTVAN